MKRVWKIVIVSLVILSTIGCGKSSQQDFVIISGSENETLQPILDQFGQKNNVKIVMHYKGSVEIMQGLAQAEIPYDAVWPANSLWISLGDKNRKVKDAKSMMTSPVVFGIKKSLAQQLGFVGKTVQVKDILGAIRQQRFSFIMTSATQSNSGASAYIGFLYALLGNPDMITSDHLRTPQLQTDIKELLAGVNRSSGSSGWLKDLFLNGNYDAMVNYESVLIETNQALIKQGKEPLYLVYPVDGIVFSDSPLGYIDHGDAKKAEVFKKLQAYLLSDNVQAQILKMGRRTGIAGMMGQVDKQVFNPDWGIDTAKILSPIKLPSAEVIQEALSLYQSEFRKPSFTV
jgi:Ca-activated chloride channel family protein